MSISPGLVIGVPTLGRPVPLSWTWAFKSMVPPINYNVINICVEGKPVADARNEIAQHAINHKAKYLFFVGDDVVCPNHTLKQLIFRMEHDSKLGVVGGVYCSKSDPPAPLVFRGNGKGSYWDWKVGEYFEVTGLGMDCTLIRVDLLKKLAFPWFKTVDSNSFMDGVNEAEQWTEDLFFLDKVSKETDYKIFCDGSVICEHWDIYNKKVYTLPSYSLPTRRFQYEGKRVVDLGCGPIKREFVEGIPVRVDIREDCNPDYRLDVRNLPFDNNSFDLVFSSHVLEHFPRAEFESVLNEWLRILDKSGELRLVLPNIEWAARELLEGKMNDDILNVFYGAQSNPYDFHYNGLTPKRMESILDKHNMKCQFEHQGYNMIISARYKNVIS